MEIEKTCEGNIIEIVNYVQKRRREGIAFDAISDELICGEALGKFVEFDVRMDAIDTVKRQEQNCGA